MSGRRAVFLDRDGTLMEEVHYCSDPALVRAFPGATESLRKLKAAGYLTVIITNQSAIGRGLMTQGQYEAVHTELLRQIGPELIDATYFCPDTPEAASACRKPEPGMVLQAAADLGISLPESFFVGDKAADIECGRRAGTKTILVLTGYGSQQECRPDFFAADIDAAAEIMLVL